MGVQLLPGYGYPFLWENAKCMNVCIKAFLTLSRIQSFLQNYHKHTLVSMAAHRVELVLEDIGKLPVFHDTIMNAKAITT